MADWQLLKDAGAVALAASERISRAARRAIAARGRFSLVLAGGTTPRQTYELLAGGGLAREAWQLYYGDERCLPPQDPARNSRMVADTGLSSGVAAHYPIPAELGPERGALAYAPLVEAALPFDMVLLGMGEDGHTASLFPGCDWPDELVIPVRGAPKPPPQRVSLGLPALHRCREMLVLVTGQAKAGAIQAWREGSDLPVARAADIPQASVLVEQGLLEAVA